MGKPLVRFWEGQESPTVWTRYCGTAAKAGGKRRRRTSSCSGGRLLPTRRQVYEATDTKLNRQVAPKILPEAFASDPDRLARFQREAKVLASLNHPNIGAVHGLEESGAIKRLVEGPTLTERMHRRPASPNLKPDINGRRRDEVHDDDEVFRGRSLCGRIRSRMGGQGRSQCG